VKPTLQPGLTLRHCYVVPKEKTVPYLFTAAEAPEIASMPGVLATPSMIAIMEWSCTRLLNQHLEPNEGSLGVRVDVTHLAATLPGQTVTVDVTIESVERGRVRFRVVANDGFDTIGQGIHERQVVPNDRFMAKLNQKAAKAGVPGLG